MATLQHTLFLDAPAAPLHTGVLVNPYCRLGGNVNHSCRQCLKRTLEAWGYDAEAYDALAVRQTANQRSKEHRQRWYVKGDPETSHKKRQVKYGITEKAFTTMLTAQGGVCALCHEPETTRLKGTLISLAVDHEHATGTVRGLLCNRCNRALGWIESLDAAWLKKARRYLAHQAQGSDRPSRLPRLPRQPHDPNTPRRLHGGRPDKLMPSQKVLALQALQDPTTNVTELAEALGVHRSTIYRTRTRKGGRDA